MTIFFISINYRYSYKSYTKLYKYTPISVIKDSTQVTLVGKTQMLTSVKIYDYLSNDLKICKEERYNVLKIRLTDKLYICK